MTALEQRLGVGTVVRSDDVNGNEVSGVAVTQTSERFSFVALFTDEGEIVSLALEDN